MEITFDLTADQARKQRVNDPEVVAAQEGTRAREPLEELVRRHREAKEARDAITAEHTEAAIPLRDRLWKLDMLEAELRAMRAEVERTKDALDAEYSARWEEADDLVMQLDEEVWREKQRLRATSEIAALEGRKVPA